jgi:sec-independent protein translocase protein TatA
MGSLGPMEILVIAGIALLLFGAGRVADLGKGLGQGIKNFKQGLREAGEDDEADEKKAAEAKPKKKAKLRVAEEADEDEDEADEPKAKKAKEA